MHVPGIRKALLQTQYGGHAPHRPTVLPSSQSPPRSNLAGSKYLQGGSLPDGPSSYPTQKHRTVERQPHTTGPRKKKFHAKRPAERASHTPHSSNFFRPSRTPKSRIGTLDGYRLEDKTSEIEKSKELRIRLLQLGQPSGRYVA